MVILLKTESFYFKKGVELAMKGMGKEWYGSRRGFDEGNSSFGSDLKHMRFIFHYDLFPYEPAIYLLLDLSPRCCDFIIVGYLSKVLLFH